MANEREADVLIRSMYDAAYEQNASIQVFENLIQEAPAMPLEVYHRLAFMFTIEDSPRPDVLRLLLQLEPDIAKLKIEDYYLLHRAVTSEACIETIQIIYDANPDAIFENDEDGVTLLHEACRHGISGEKIRLLLSWHPGAAGIVSKTYGSSLPIHMAMQLPHPVDEETVLVLLDAFRGAASVRDGDGWLPLHRACAYYYSFDLVKRLVEIYPQGLSTQDTGGNISLHYACLARNPSLDTVKFLLDKCPKGISARNGRGLLPLHFAVGPLTCAQSFIQYVIEAYPEAVNITDNGGCLPLHKACLAGATRDVLQLLLDRYTGDDKNHRGLSAANNDGRLPLHCLCSSHDTDTDSVQQLLDLYPQGIRVADRDGLLPLHAAFSPKNRPVFHIICLLVKADLYTVVQKNRNGDTPYHLAWGLQDRQVEIEAFLFEKQNEAVAALKEACESVTATQLGLPDLVVALVWSFAKPDLWVPHDG